MLRDNESSNGPTSSKSSAEHSTRSHGYAFLLNVGSLVDITEAELLPGHVLRRASSDEITQIKETVQQLAAGFQTFQIPYLWEQRWPHPGGRIEILLPEKWRYFVLAFEGTNATYCDLSCVFPLLDAPLIDGFTIAYAPISVGPIVIGNQVEFFHAVEHACHGDWKFHDVTQADVEQLRRLHHAFLHHDHELLNIRQITLSIERLNGMPHDLPLRFLGYFALLESLLTHAPQPSDPYDSITRQVKKKLALLNKRFRTPIDYTKFGGAQIDTVWSKMYSYRSAIAHGGSADFTNQLAVLRSPAEALRLIQEATRAVARHGLEEPQLIIDLRDC